MLVDEIPIELAAGADNLSAQQVFDFVPKRREGEAVPHAAAEERQPECTEYCRPEERMQRRPRAGALTGRVGSSDAQQFTPLVPMRR